MLLLLWTMAPVKGQSLVGLKLGVYCLDQTVCDLPVSQWSAESMW